MIINHQSKSTKPKNLDQLNKVFLKHIRSKCDPTISLTDNNKFNQ